MALRLDDKKAVVEKVSSVAAVAHSAIAAEYRGMTVAELTELRKLARNSDVHMQVVKNTLAKRAVQGTQFECMSDSLVGPLVLAFSMEDPGSAARLFKGFTKEHKLLDVKLVAVGGQLYNSSELERLSSLPTRDQGISLLMAVMKAPVEKFVRTLVEPPAKLARTLVAVKTHKESN